MFFFLSSHIIQTDILARALSAFNPTRENTCHFEVA